MIHKLKLLRIKFVWTAMLLLVSTFLFAQQELTVKGTVFDESRIPIIGATVTIDGTTRGTVTDFDGNFQIDANEGSIMSVSYLGYITQKVKVEGQKNYTITLKEETQNLGEVVVVGYGQQKKETLTGAISSVGTETLVNSPNASVANSLQGRMPGLTAVANSGQPGMEDPKIFIRGLGSLNESSSAPLILIDGVEGSFSQMDPNEIESISILKDASATAVFGVRGANGVILVTSQRGKEGKARISVNSSFGVESPTRILETADSYTFATAHNTMSANDGIAKEHWAFNDYALERFRLGDDPIMYPDVDWREVLMKKASMKTQHNINVSGGTQKVRYFISAGYLYQNGMFESLDPTSNEAAFTYNRYNYRSNFDINLTKTTTMKVGMSGILSQTHAPEENLWDYFKWTTPMSSPGLNEAGQLIIVAPERFPGLTMDNNVMRRNYMKGSEDQTKNSATFNMALNQKLDFITKGLSLEVKADYNSSYSHVKTFGNGRCDILEPYYTSELDGLLSGIVDSRDPNFNPDVDFEGDYNKDIVYLVEQSYRSKSFSESSGRGRNWYMEGSLRYNRKFNDHTVSGLLLYNQSKKYYLGGIYNAIPRAYVGVVGRVTYDYRSKYMAEVNAGYNGSENFAPGKRFALFPSGSLGWAVSEEGFMKDQKVIDYLKLRASVGLVGNDYTGSSDRFLYLPGTYNVDLSGTDNTWKHNLYGYNFGTYTTQIVNGALEAKLSNPDVTWEKALKQNYGFDLGILGNRLKLTADYFREWRTDILLTRKVVPIMSSLTSSLMSKANLGVVQNHGYELDLKWNDQVNEDFGYNIGFNMSFARNRIIEQDEIPPAYQYMSSTGHPVGTVFGYKTDGFYTNEDFKLTEDGELLLGDKGQPQLVDGLPKPVANVHPGDIKYLDLNDDGKITDRDVTAIGKPKRPEYTFGLNMNFTYKDFFLGMSWAGVTGSNILFSNTFRSPFDGGNRSLYQFQADNAWTPETANTATLPRLSSSMKLHNTLTSDLWLINGSYLRLKNLSIGYNVSNQRVLKALGAKGISVTFTGYNLLTFDHLKIMDPESNASDSETYPITRTFNLAVGLTF